ncbi:5-(carboxyamino)imidazole ribonucleotide synthase [Thiorhodovibrio frisius]|uniref:N5-carboxyaminoimidazole ribonucleotide synthase n=1 Tax=Thiorhodovibrio frisius TaxID=631362 RepID=H8YWP3_9GAMM|nr:5-(carboxyamino)imidazole ribonucleotide synthase [Thiorhodovibrio frisius]EIC22869.1 phosphoribosylaminoimidazole carboxylase, PurK protein [Thiorhodovibrio frisius]WPL22873.1 N5-carboxyaminoimidazole ribonucleotide synthase [Thiorhodovibrio frisius]
MTARSDQDSFPYPVARIGIIGGGQLGRMMVKAAKQLGCTCTVLDPTPNSPAGQVSGHQIVANYQDAAALRELAESCDLTTFDLENIDSAILAELSREGRPIFPHPDLLAVVQDKLRQKEVLAAAGIPVAAFRSMPEPDAALCAEFGYPLVQKARRGGYDGRGVAVLRGPEDFASHLPVSSLIERFVPAAKELAVMVARARDGDCRSYPAVEMRVCPAQNILDQLLAPARISGELAAAAEQLAIRTVQALDGVGIFGIEMFLTPENDLLVNEVAPRTHNSGHYTIEACVTDQFEQHLRAIAGLPLGATDLLCPAAMVNLLGAPGHHGRPVIKGLRAALAIPGVSVHIYGKAATHPYRKMGHVTVLDTDLEQARCKAEQVRELIEITGEDHP